MTQALEWGVLASHSENVSKVTPQEPTATRFHVAAILDASPRTMYGHATQDTLDGGSSYLVAEYARAKGILKLKHNDRTFEIPGMTIWGHEVVYISRKAVNISTRMSKWLRDNPDSIKIGWDSLIAIQLPQDQARTDFFDALMVDFSITATSPLKHDIVTLHEWAKDWPFSWLITSLSSGGLTKMLRRKYRIGDNPSWESEKTFEWHKFHYQRLLWIDGVKPPRVYPTLSGKSANTAVIRDISRLVSSHAISVYPGYFFLNEGDFPQWSTNTVSAETQALFASVESWYAGKPNETYTRWLSEEIRKIIELAKNNPTQTYYISLDVTSDIFSYREWELWNLIQEGLTLPNIRVVISSSLTKYNRNEPNYHYGVIADFSKEDSQTLENLVETSYGWLSPLWILQYPRLKKGELSHLKSQAQENSQAFLSWLQEALWESWDGIIEIESYTPYSYIRFPWLPDEKRNTLVAAFLKNEIIRAYVGSSFYLDDFRICDVPDVDCSRFSNNSAHPFRNNIRVSFSTWNIDAHGMGHKVGITIKTLLEEISRD